MEYLTLPLDLSIIESLDFENILIDMSDLRFPCSPELKIRSTYIFIRNIDIDMKLDFSKCTYEEKEKFILMYLKGNINVNIPIIRDTWLDILYGSNPIQNELYGILTHDEIKKFIKNNYKFVHDVYKLISSLPVLAIYNYSKSNASGAELINFDGEFEETDYNEINFHNFALLTENDEYFGLVYLACPKYPLLFYKKYFDGDDHISMSRINSRLPIMELLNIFFGPTEVQYNFIDGINEILTPEEVESNE